MRERAVGSRGEEKEEATETRALRWERGRRKVKVVRNIVDGRVWVLVGLGRGIGAITVGV